jgi:tetratricopeptide (TPR) repeat protein/tRNA A-37 threonylcarbamoyl transferase component Bud32
MENCLTVNLILDLLEGELPEPRIGEVKQHLDQCGLCRDVLDEMTVVYSSGPLADSARALLRPGSVIVRYHILAPIGAGAMGTVYSAYDPVLDRRVALKLVRQPRVATDEGRQLILHEAQAMARLQHPNVVAVHDAGAFEDQLFIAMELVDGENVRSWLRQRSASWRAIVEVFLHAGRGLAAAHRAGLVHRDFKPENVLVGRDGIARVTDFGLARLHPLGPTAPSTRPTTRTTTTTATSKHANAADGHTFTRAGLLVGTPAYMALEQLTDGKADPHSDQFSFCVALYEALYGKRPFVADSIRGLAAAIASGQLPPPPPSARVPAHLRAVLQRGLAAAPEDRFASMDALLTALAHDPARQRRRLIAASALGVVLLGGIAALRAPRAEPCGGAARQLTGVWDPAQRQAVQAAFSATRARFAEASFTAAAGLLDRYLTAWRDIHHDACIATRIRGEQSEEVMELRMECLDRRRGEVRALVDLMARADARVVERAVTTVHDLPSLDECSNADALRQLVRPPANPAARAKVAELRSRLAEIGAQLKIGRNREAQKPAEAAVADARAVGYAPVLSEALYWQSLADYRGGDVKRAVRSLVESAAAAENGRDDLQKARSLGLNILVTTEGQARYDNAHEYYVLARAALARAGGDALLETRLDRYEAVALARQARYTESFALNQRVLTRLEQLFGPNDPEVAVTLHAMGESYETRGQLDDALAVYRRALKIQQATFGPDHPWTAMALNDLGIISYEKGDTEAAIAAWWKVLAIREAAFGPGQGDVTATLSNLGSALIRLRQLDKARPLLERAYADKVRALGPDHPSVGLTLAALAELRMHEGVLDPALADAQRALTIREKAYGPEHPDVAASLTTLGQIHLARHEPSEALRCLDRALAIFEHHPGDFDVQAAAHFAQARAAWAAGRDRTRARADALAVRDHLFGYDRTEVDTWLATHR